MRYDAFGQTNLTLRQKLWQVQWLFIFLLTSIAGVGFVVLYSAAGGSIDPWASRQLARFAAGLGVLLVVAMIDIRLWFKYAYLLYATALVLLVIVEFAGVVGMGAQRWIVIGFINFQPSEVMKVMLVLALARHFHGLGAEDVRRPISLIIPLMLVGMPAALVLRQPDLGTATMLSMSGAVMFFLAGVRMWKFVAVGLAGIGMAPIAWQFLREYQRQRVLTFLNPENDPLGSGYHIIQSKIALGSGGLFGKGYLQGTQSHLSFLPEKQTDFIFTMLAEELGMVGGLALLGLYLLTIAFGFGIAMGARSQFGRLLAMGVTSTFFLYVFINVAMVMGLIPVVGVPLPLISYGGTAMMTLLFAFGLLMGVHVHREVFIGRRDSGQE